MSQSATFTPSSVPIPAISHFIMLGLSPESREYEWKIFKVSKIEIAFFRKNKVESSA